MAIALSTSSLPTPPTKATLATALKPAIASKQYGYEDKLADLVAEAALTVMPPNPKNFNVDNVRVVKIMGGNLAGSKVVRGMVFGKEPEGEHECVVCHGVCLTVLRRNCQESSEREGCCLHMCTRHCPDGDERHGPPEECRRDAQLHPWRGATARKGSSNPCVRLLSH